MVLRTVVKRQCSSILGRDSVRHWEKRLPFRVVVVQEIKRHTAWQYIIKKRKDHTLQCARASGLTAVSHSSVIKRLCSGRLMKIGID